MERQDGGRGGSREAKRRNCSEPDAFSAEMALAALNGLRGAKKHTDGTRLGLPRESRNVGTGQFEKDCHGRAETGGQSSSKKADSERSGNR
eukprot:6189646-Pleurochrysis_carterae.AAC.2